MQVDMREAKNQLSKLVKAAFSGEEVIIASNRQPQVRLVPCGDAQGLGNGSWGLQVSLVRNGVGACQRSAAEAGAFDLVLLDVRLSLRKPVDIARLRKTIADALNRR